MSRSLWHPAFFQALQAELIEFLPVLEFIPEYQLTEEPQRLDVLVIKKKPEVVITKNIGRIFQNHNVVEYKSPRDTASRGDYYKTLGYCLNYAFIHGIDIEEMSLSIAVSKMPRKLMTYLKKKRSIASTEIGIYTVSDELLPVQIIVSSELSEEENILLSGLRPDLPLDGVRRTLDEGERCKSVVRLDAYFRVLFDENTQRIQEIQEMKRGWFSVLLEETRAEGEAKGLTEGLTEGKAESILKVLQRRFKQVPKPITDSVRSYTDLTALDSLLELALDCQTINEFKEHCVK